MGVWLLNQLAAAILGAIASRMLDYLIENRHVLLASGEATWNESGAFVSQITREGWQRHDAAIAGVAQAFNGLLDEIEQCRVSGRRQCRKTIECIQSILFMELQWAW